MAFSAFAKRLRQESKVCPGCGLKPTGRSKQTIVLLSDQPRRDAVAKLGGLLPDSGLGKRDAT